MLITPVKERITKAVGRRWTVAQIAERAGVLKSEVSMSLQCTEDAECKARHTPGVQDAVSKAVGVSTAKLFGKHAWFKLAGKGLCRKLRSARRSA